MLQAELGLARKGSQLAWQLVCLLPADLRDLTAAGDALPAPYWEKAFVSLYKPSTALAVPGMMLVLQELAALPIFLLAQVGDAQEGGKFVGRWRNRKICLAVCF